MTQVNVRIDPATRLDLPGSAHRRCGSLVDESWSLCLTSWPGGFVVSARSAEWVRVLIGEPATRGRHPMIADQVQSAAAKLLEVRCSAVDTVDVLCRLLARQLGGDQLPGPSLTLIDLHKSGRTDIAARVAPPVLYVGARAPFDLTHCAGSGGVNAESLDVEPGDYLVALSPASIRTLSVDGLRRIPERIGAISDPCQLRDELLEAVDGRARHKPAPPMAIVRRRVTRAGATW